MTPVVVGVDPSKDATGVALPDGTAVVWPPLRSNMARAERLNLWARRFEATLERYLIDIDVVVYEDIGGGGSRFAMAGQAAASLRTLAEVAAYRAGVPFVLFHPGSLKRFATGNGNADKPAMLAAAQAAGADVADHNAADAWLLRAVGVLAMGGPDLLEPSQGRDPGHRVEAVATVTWPRVGR